jgi:hypothetical protein
MSQKTPRGAWSFGPCLQQCSSHMRIGDMAEKVSERNRVIAGQVWIVILAAMFLSCMPSALRAATDTASPKQTVTLAQYESELDRISSAVSKLSDAPEEISAVRQTIPSGWIVATDGGQFEISAEWLTGSLNEIENNFKEWKKQCAGFSGQPKEVCLESATEENVKELRKQCADSAVLQKNPCSYMGMLNSLRDWKMRSNELAAQIQKLRSEAESLARTASSTDVTNAHAKLTQILSGREYQTVKGESWLGQMWDQVGRWITWILDHTIGRLLEKGPVRTTIFWLLVVGVFLLIALRVVRILTRLARSEALRVDGAFPPGKNWRDWSQKALASARIGDYRSALHSAYWAGIYRLADTGAWRLDQARTPREYLRLLKYPPEREAGLPAAQPATDPGRVTALTALTRSMESAWYGYIPATAQEFESAIDNLETLGCKLRSTAQTANS